MSTHNPFARFDCLICGKRRPTKDRNDVISGNRVVAICKKCLATLTVQTEVVNP